MSTSKDLLLAILSMDAYNRGYGAGLNLGENSDAIDKLVGTAKIVATRGQPDAQAVGFYAIAYTLADGSTVISYRGTDGGLSQLLTDAWNGYGVGAGSPNGPQAQLAIQ